jgi:protein-S-isoprenylcysteine O-methyltransferase Ste14
MESFQMSAKVRHIVLSCAQLAFTLLLIFGPAGTFAFWQGWVFLGVCAAASVAIGGYLKKKDPKLLQRRMRGPWAEKDPGQKLLQFLVIVAWTGAIGLSSLDRRFLWSQAPLYLDIAGFCVLALGFLAVFLAFKENTFAAVNIEVEADQTVISTGPYAIVRHPMYTGLLLAVLGTPLALGSTRALIVFVPMVLVIAWRVSFEERFLTEHLAGYASYRRSVRYRVVPFIW